MIREINWVVATPKLKVLSITEVNVIQNNFVYVQIPKHL